MNAGNGSPANTHLFRAVLLLAALSFAAAPARADPSAKTLVVIEAVKFSPEITSVKRGEWVQWINKDPFPHTVTSPGAFDSHSIPAGGKWRHRANKVGEFHYICTLHPNMNAVLRVER
jgi:plastocyanin